MLHEDIQEQIEKLGFKGMLPTFSELVESSNNHDMPWQQVIKMLLAAEITYRQTRSFMYRLNLARLPQMKTLETFDCKSSAIEQNTLDQVGTCEFIKANENILLIGGSGSGKSHIALALAYIALQQKYRVRFYRFNELARCLLTAQEHHYENNLIARLQRFHLLIVDELGYVPIDQKAGALLFELFSGLYEKASVIITTHLMFDEWTDIFGNKKSTKAMIDRLTHHCKILETGNDSWRLKEGNKMH